jgi:hypothetical protein
MEFLSTIPIPFIVISSFFSIMIFVFAAFVFITNKHKKQNSIQIEAEIIEVLQVGEEEGQPGGMYFPILRYEYNGEVYEESVNYLVSHESMLKVGSKIKVSIREDDPHNVQLAFNGGLFFLFIFVGIFVIMIFGMLVMMGVL